MNAIAAIGTQMREVASPEFKLYAERVLGNAKALAEGLNKRGFTLQTGGTDNHLIVWNVKALGLTGSKVEKILEIIGISVNKNTIIGDTNAQVPGGVRIGTPLLTTRGFTEADMDKIASFFAKAVELALETQKQSGKLLKDFQIALEKDPRIAVLRKEIAIFAASHPLPGVDDTIRAGILAELQSS